MSQQSSTGKLIVTAIAVTGVVLWKMFGPKKPVQKRREVKKTMQKTNIEKSHKIELEKFIGKLNLVEANTFLKYLWEMERSATTVNQEQLMIHITFLLRLRNDKSPQSRMILRQACADFPGQVATMVRDLTEMRQKVCYAMARGVVDCLLEIPAAQPAVEYEMAEAM